MMDDKKRKKFGLSLKNAKKQAVTKNEIKEQRSTEKEESRNSKEQKFVSVLGPRSCLEECGLTRKQLKSSVNTLEKESLVHVNDEEERERILWKNLFSENSSGNWETMEDLPISNDAHASRKECKASNSERMGKKVSMKIEDGNNTISSSLALDFEVNQESNSINIDLDYEDLPEPCIACYARKPCLLTWSGVDDDKILEENDTYIVSPSQKDLVLDTSTSTSSIKKSLQNNSSSTSIFQKNADASKSQMNAKPATKLFNQNMKRKDSILQLHKTNKNQTIKTNAGCLSKPSEGKHHIDTAVNWTSNDSHEKLDNRVRIGRKLDFTSTKEQTFNKQNDYVLHTNKSTSLRINNADLKVKSEKLNSTVGDSGAKRNDAVVKKEILKCCPICQFQFPQRMSRQGIDQHISCCIGNEELFIDDDEEDW